MRRHLALFPSFGVLAIASIAVAAPPDAGDDSALVCVLPPFSADRSTLDPSFPEPAAQEPPAAGPRSVGWPWRGSLPGGVPLHESQLLRESPHCVVGGRFYGTPELVGMLERSAASVASRLTVGELSTPGGGRVIGHRSHTNGRDADVAFYLAAPDGALFEADDYLDVHRDGTAVGGVARFDDARNWALVRTWLSDPVARVQYVFVEAHLRARLLAEAQREGAGAELLARAGHTLMQPPRGDPHRDHFHVRVFCDPRDRPSCRDKAPYWPWYAGLAEENGALPLATMTDWVGE